MPRKTATPKSIAASHATWRTPIAGRPPEPDELCSLADAGFLLYCDSHEMHARVDGEREGRAMGEAHAAALAEGCDLYLLRIRDRHLDDQSEEDYIETEEGSAGLVALFD